MHTELSADSNTAAEAYLEANHAAGSSLGAICFTEHRLYPTDARTLKQYGELSEKYGVHIFRGLEADTDLGHLLLFGITDAVMMRFDLGQRMLRSRELIRVLHDEGGIAIPAHPFRDSGYGHRLSELQAQLGTALTAIETINGQNTPEQNRLAVEIGEKTKLTGVAGSDAHFASGDWFLTCATEFAVEVRSVDAMCAELRGGRVHARLLNQVR